MIEFYSFLDDEEHGCRMWRSENNCLADVHAVRWLNEEGNARRFAVLEWSGFQEPRRETDTSAAACAHALSRAFTSLGSSPANEINKTMCTPLTLWKIRKNLARWLCNNLITRPIIMACNGHRTLSRSLEGRSSSTPGKSRRHCAWKPQQRRAEGHGKLQRMQRSAATATAPGRQLDAKWTKQIVVDEPVHGCLLVCIYYYCLVCDDLFLVLSSYDEPTEA
jgi:hypothetical protein